MAKVQLSVIRKAMDSPNPPAGKKPMRRPMLHLSSPQPSDPKEVLKAKKAPGGIIKPNKYRAVPRRAAAGNHRMMTRSKSSSKSKPFRLFDLPAELRNRIYEFATHEDGSITLKKFKLPLIASLSRQLRSEVVPIFFAVNTFTCTVRSNWCGIADHWHDRDYVFFDQTGKMTLSRTLPVSAVPFNFGLADKAVRFHHVRFHVQCSGCLKPCNLMVVDVHVDKVNTSVTYAIHEKFVKGSVIKLVIIVTAMAKLFKQAKERAELLSEREKFDGFSTQDIKKIARGFKYVEEPEVIEVED